METSRDQAISDGEIDLMLATIQMSGTSTYWALPERTKFSVKTSIRLEKIRGNRFKASKQANRNFYKVEKWTRDGMKVDSLLYARQQFDQGAA